jgi:copper homeostasis protein
MNKNFSLEICVGSIESCLEAEKGGADRVELCDNLFEGGTTPSIATIIYAKEHLILDTMVMIRPRGGDFLYSDIEFELMKKDIEYCKRVGVKGVVFGLLLNDGRVDKQRVRELVEIAKPLDVCFHRAIDMSNDYLMAARDIVDCGCKRILTSGQRNKAIEGIDNIASLQKCFGNQIEVMAGSGVSEDNVEEIYKKTKINAFHLSAKREIKGNMMFHQKNVSMGGVDSVSEYDIIRTDFSKVKRVKEKLSLLLS